MPDVSASDIAVILSVLGGVWGVLRGKKTAAQAFDNEGELRAAVMVAVESYLLDEAEGTARELESNLRAAAVEAADRLKLPRSVTAPLIRIAVQAGMTEARRVIAQRRALHNVRTGPAKLADAADGVLREWARAEARGLERATPLGIVEHKAGPATVEGPAMKEPEDAGSSDGPSEPLPASLLSGNPKG